MVNKPCLYVRADGSPRNRVTPERLKNAVDDAAPFDPADCDDIVAI
jgi:hypothetical protein